MSLSARATRGLWVIVMVAITEGKVQSPVALERHG
jgi:hypothetical protein